MHLRRVGENHLMKLSIGRSGKNYFLGSLFTAGVCDYLFICTGIQVCTESDVGAVFNSAKPHLRELDGTGAITANPSLWRPILLRDIEGIFTEI
jgi:hypothetical protein